MRLPRLPGRGRRWRSLPAGDRMDFDVEIAVRLHWAGVPIVNVPTGVRYLSRAAGGTSHFRPVRDNVALTLDAHPLAVRLPAVEAGVRPEADRMTAPPADATPGCAPPSAGRRSPWRCVMRSAAARARVHPRCCRAGRLLLRRVRAAGAPRVARLPRRGWDCPRAFARSTPTSSASLTSRSIACSSRSGKHRTFAITRTGKEHLVGLKQQRPWGVAARRPPGQLRSDARHGDRHVAAAEHRRLLQERPSHQRRAGD